MMDSSTKFIPIVNRGIQVGIALIDAEDCEHLSQWSWHLSGSYVARGRRKEDPSSPYLIYMHRVITGAPKGFHVDHRNHVTTDNRRENLRICTKAQNLHYRNKAKANSGVGLIGVHPSGKSRFTARIRLLDGKRVSLGTYPTPEEAARIYDQAARHVRGEYASLNYPDQPLVAVDTEHLRRQAGVKAR